MGVIVPDAVERYLATLNRSHGAVLDDIARAGAQRNLPLVDAEVGALLRVLATAVSATRILEIGTARSCRDSCPSRFGTRKTRARLPSTTSASRPMPSWSRRSFRCATACPSRSNVWGATALTAHETHD